MTALVRPSLEEFPPLPPGIFIVGLPLVGKTTLRDEISGAPELEDIRSYLGGIATITDFDNFLLPEVIRDDALTGGAGHYHLWNKPTERGQTTVHTHADGSPTIPFGLVDQSIMSRADTKLAQAVAGAPLGQPLVVEWAHGRKLPDFPNDHPLGVIDCSAWEKSKLLTDSRFNLLRRIHKVIHITMQHEVRSALNNAALERMVTVPTVDARPPTLLNAMGIDDFDDIRHLYKKARWLTFIIPVMKGFIGVTL